MRAPPPFPPQLLLMAGSLFSCCSRVLWPMTPPHCSALSSSAYPSVVVFVLCTAWRQFFWSSEVGPYRSL